ncbi:MAG: helix-turn-helix transcriptional regulator [Flavobacteriaceae bacterium]|nr:helix-turn-helix transcriptional regulator [Flavobacteriaceae bacterium]MDG1962297.1 helix-turn-helix transcriptional regulator [Flavobacteriaceae bacterium]
MKCIAEKIKTTRISKKISQESLAYACGLSRNYVGVIEKGKNKISLEVFLKLCVGLQIHPSEILNDFTKEELETFFFG